MSISVRIKQRFLRSKPMPLSVILGDNLRYGNFVNDHLEVGKLGSSGFVAYNPECIGRGFSVVWTPSERKKIDLHLPQPSTTQELSDFFAAVERIVNFWRGSLLVDGNRMSLSEFFSHFDGLKEFNDQTIKDFSRRVLDGNADECLTLPSTMWPLSLGKAEAEIFLEDTSKYSIWLHEKQSVDACFGFAIFHPSEEGISGDYFFIDDTSAIFPRNPSVPFGMIDTSTGKPLICNDWNVMLFVSQEIEPALIGELKYSEFISRIPAHKISQFDGDKILISAMSATEIQTLVDI